jgi:biopolymer transport protein ExbB/TolQ
MPQLSAFAVIAVVLTALALLGLRGLVEPALVALGLPALATATRAFFFERSVVQWCTLAVFFFAVTVLAARLMHHLALQRSLRATAEDGATDSLPAVRVARLLRERLEQTHARLTSDGPRAAFARAQELDRRDEDELEQVYTLLGSVVQVMLALGFLGTVWGISRSMFGSFSHLSDAAPEQIGAGLKQFTSALSTALDTTVLALVCGILTSVALTAMRWAEVGGLGAVTELVRRRFNLGANEQPDPAAQMAAELQAVAAAGVKQLRDFAGAALDAYQQKVSELTRRHVEGLTEQMARTLGEQARAEWQLGLGNLRQELNTRLDDAGAALEAQSKGLRKELAEGLARVEQGLGRIPEISIRYPQTAAQAEPDGQGTRLPADPME